MTRADKRIIDNTVAARRYIYGWQDSIEREQERVIGDLVSPAKTVVAQLIKLDNMRIDLCNLKVLYEFIKRGVGESIDRIFGESGVAPKSAYETAKKQIELAGYSLDRIKTEFEYLFKKIRRTRPVVLEGPTYIIRNA